MRRVGTVDKTRKSGVYRILNSISGKSYIGSGKYIKSRWARHRSSLIKGTHWIKDLQEDWDNLGESVFVFEVVEECCGEELKIREQYYLDKTPIKYNRGTLVNGGFHHSDEAKEKLREIFKGRPPANKGIPRKPETIQKLKEAWARKKERGYTMSPETREKVSIALKGKPKTAEHIASLTGRKMNPESVKKASLSRTGMKRSEDAKLKMRVVQIELIKLRTRDEKGRIVSSNK